MSVGIGVSIGAGGKAGRNKNEDEKEKKKEGRRKRRRRRDGRLAERASVRVSDRSTVDQKDRGIRLLRSSIDTTREVASARF